MNDNSGIHNLTAQPRADAAQQGEVVAWQARRTDGSPLAQWEACTREAFEATVTTGRYLGFENGPTAEARALYTAPPSVPAPVAGDAVGRLPEKWRDESMKHETYGHAACAARRVLAIELESALAQDRASQAAAPSAPVGVEAEPSPVRALVAAANAVLAENPSNDGMWTLEQAVRPFNATKPAECADGCPPQQVCDYCQIAALAQQPAAVDGAVKRLAYALLMHDQHRTTVQSLASAVGDFLRDYNAAQPGGSDNDR